MLVQAVTGSQPTSTGNYVLTDDINTKGSCSRCRRRRGISKHLMSSDGGGGRCRRRLIPGFLLW
jgi:hypothetical protein